MNRNTLKLKNQNESTLMYHLNKKLMPNWTNWMTSITTKFKKSGLMYFLRTSTIWKRRCRILKRKLKKVEILFLYMLVKRKKDMRLKSILIWLTIISKKATMLTTISNSLYLLKILEGVRVNDLDV